MKEGKESTDLAVAEASNQRPVSIQSPKRLPIGKMRGCGWRRRRLGRLTDLVGREPQREQCGRGDQKRAEADEDELGAGTTRVKSWAAARAAGTERAGDGGGARRAAVSGTGWGGGGGGTLRRAGSAQQGCASVRASRAEEGKAGWIDEGAGLARGDRCVLERQTRARMRGKGAPAGQSGGEEVG